MKNVKKIATEILAEVVNLRIKPTRPLTPKQEEGLKDVKKTENMEEAEHHVLENKGRPKVMLNNPKKKEVKIVELDNAGRGKEI